MFKKAATTNILVCSENLSSERNVGFQKKIIVLCIFLIAIATSFCQKAHFRTTILNFCISSFTTGRSSKNVLLFYISLESGLNPARYDLLSQVKRYSNLLYRKISNIFFPFDKHVFKLYKPPCNATSLTVNKMINDDSYFG